MWYYYLSFQSISLPVSIEAIPWWTCPYSFRTTINIILARCKMLPKLTALGFFNVNVETFGNVNVLLNISFSLQKHFHFNVHRKNVKWFFCVTVYDRAQWLNIHIQ